MKETREIFEPIDTERVRKTVDLALSQKGEVRDMKKVLGVFDIDEGLLNKIRYLNAEGSGLDRVTIRKLVAERKWKTIAIYDEAALWDLGAEVIVHAISVRALCALPLRYKETASFRVEIRHGSRVFRHTLNIILSENEYAQIRYGGLNLDPHQYSNVCLDLVVTNSIMHYQRLGKFGDVFPEGYGARQKRAALDRMIRCRASTIEDCRTYRSFEVDPGIARGVFRHSGTQKIYFLSQRPPSASEGDYYMNYDDAGAWVWTTKWEQLCVNTDSESPSSTLTPCDKRAFEKAYKEARESPDSRESSGLVERIEVVGGPLPELPKAEPICPECHGTGEVLNFHQYHPCPRGCKKP
jgi:hypothetical protein